MATKVKPTRLQITGTPQVGQVPTYVDKNTFAWGAGGGGGASFGRFLSLWDCTTGLPISFPEATPYTYLTGDYYIVETVSSATPPVNYKPDGSTYTGVASSTTESDELEVGDVYVYDGTVWLLQSNHGKTVTFANIAGQPTDNLNLAADLNAKQDNLTAGTGIDITSNTVSTASIFGESSTAAATVQKEVSIPSITTLNVGQVIIVKPTVTSTVANSTLKLNSFPAYSMLYNGANITTSTDSIVRGANIPSVFVLDEVSGTKYWRFVAHGLDSNSTYTINYYYDAGKYKAGTGTYAITRYSLCMMKPNMTWEKITATNANYTTAATKSVNTNGFVLNQIRYYNTTTAIGANTFVGVNTFQNQAASINAAYSFNSGTAPVGRSTGTYIYLVGTIGVDGLFYLDTTTRWSHTLPSTNDGKLYIRLGVALTDTDATMSFLADRPIFYYDNGIKEYTTGKIDELETGLATKQDELVSGVNIRTINGTSILGNGDIETPTGIPSQTGEAGKFLTTDGTSVSWGAIPTGDISYIDFETASVAGATVTLSYLTTKIIPASNFTVTCGTVKEGMQYILRVISGATAYTMSLGTGVTNPFGEDLTLTASKTTTVVLFATSSSALEVFSVRTES